MSEVEGGEEREEMDFDLAITIVPEASFCEVRITGGLSSSETATILVTLGPDLVGVKLVKEEIRLTVTKAGLPRLFRGLGLVASSRNS